MGKNKLYMFLSILFVIITCSIYQAYLGVTIGLSLLLIIKQLIKNYNVKDVFINFFKYMLIIFAGCVFYYILLKLILLINNLTLASYKGANDLGLNTLIQMPKSIVQCYKDFFNFYFDNNIIFNSYYHRKENVKIGKEGGAPPSLALRCSLPTQRGHPATPHSIL